MTSKQEKLIKLIKDNGSVDEIKRVIFELVNDDGLDFTDDYGITPLIWASTTGREEVVKELLDKGVNVNITDKKGFTALMMAAQNGYIEVVKQILDIKDRQVEIDKINYDGWTALMLAIMSGRKDVVRELIARGADIYKKDKYDDTVFKIAEDYNRKEIVEILNAEVAKRLKQQELIELIKQKKTVQEVEKIVTELTVYGGINFIDHEGQTPLMVAAINNNVEIIKLLLNKGANISMKTASGETALELAQKNNKDRAVRLLKKQDEKISKLRVLLSLVKRNSPINDIKTVMDDVINNYGVDLEYDDNSTLLHLAAFCGDLESVKKLLNRGVSVDKANKQGDTALMYAAYRGHLFVVKELLIKGADIEKKNNGGATALDMAQRNRMGPIVDLLKQEQEKRNKQKRLIQIIRNRVQSKDILEAIKQLDVYGSIDLINDGGTTALHEAVKGNYIEVARELLIRGANINTRDNDGNTPLMLAVYYNNIVVTENLIKMGADINIANSFKNYKVIDIARYYGYESMVSLLERSKKRERDGKAEEDVAVIETERKAPRIETDKQSSNVETKKAEGVVLAK